MDQFFAKDFSGEPFVMFGLPHLAVLVLLLAVNLALPGLRGHAKARQYFRYGLAALLLVNEFAWHIWNAAVGQWTLQTMLPLHLCSVLVWTSAVMLLTQNYQIYELIYLMGIGGAIQAVLTPDLGVYGYPHFRFFQTFLSHGGIIVAALFMTLVEGLRPYWRSLWRVFVVMNIYVAVVFVINLILGSNYLFIMHPPETPSLIDALGPWPWYLIPLELIGVVTCLVLYMPFAIKDWLASRSAQPAG
jgi:hypothetical integral membrane protein (TIGR02206 family)